MMAQDNARDTDSISDVVAGLKDIAQNNTEISVRDITAEFGNRSFAPFILILALIGLLPTGTIPGVPTAVAFTIVMVALQMVFGHSHIWIPGFIANRSVPADKLQGAEDTLDWIANKLDAVAKGRLKFLVSGVGMRVVGAIMVVLCCFVPMLEVVPFAAAGPFAAIALLSLSLIVRDGLITLLAAALALVAVTYGVGWLSF